MRPVKQFIRNTLPPQAIDLYHRLLARFGDWFFGHPSHDMIVIGVTGTKGKSSTIEMVNAILEEAGHKTAVLDSIRLKVGPSSSPNVMRMSMPGRMYLQRFLHAARAAGCGVAILEMTSEGARQYRHQGIALDALIFTNLAPEHIESHGSYQAYADAKYSIATDSLVGSLKRPRIMVANADDPESARYFTLPVEILVPCSLKQQAPFAADDTGGYFQLDDTRISVRLPGEFSLRNALCAASLARVMKIPTHKIAAALSKLTLVPGRAERIEEGQDFAVVVDYAHTPDSLKALYEAYALKKKVCVLGATGGGRDSWKRPVMGALADQYCEHVILTNEDPYDEDPDSIIGALRSGMKREPEIIIDRREAIAKALSMAQNAALRRAEGDQNGYAVLITGKGTDPTIQLAAGASVPWSDAQVAREELAKLTATKGTPGQTSGTHV